MKTFQKRVSLDLGLLKPLVAIPGDVTQDGEIDLFFKKGSPFDV